MPNRRPSITPRTAARFVRGCICAAPSAGRRSEAFAVCSASMVRSCCSLSISRQRVRRALEPRLLELVDPAAKLLAGSDERFRVELSPVRDELLCMQRRKPRGRLLVSVGDVEVEDVRVSCGRDECAAEERAGVEPGILAASTTRFATSGDMAICVCVCAIRCGSW